MRATTQPRVRAGVPAGGQFAPTHRPEANGIVLTEEPDPPNAGSPGGEGLAAPVVLAEVTLWGRRYARRYGADAEEVAGSAALAFYEQRARREVAGKAAIDDSAYLNTLARNIALQAIGADRSYVRQAFRAYQARCDSLTQDLGRELSQREEDEIAAAIVAAQGPRRRAPADFHRRAREVSLDAPSRGRLNEDGSTIAESLVSTDDPTEHAAPVERSLGGLGERAEQLAAAGDHAGAKRLAWDALAELSGAPKVVPSSVTERRAATARKAIAEAGGPGSVAAAYELGLAEPEATTALFAPFGPLDDSGRDGVVAVLLSRSYLAGELWDLALRSATTPRATSGRPAPLLTTTPRGGAR